MIDLILQLIEWLKVNGILELAASLLISCITLLITLVKTRTSAIQKKAGVVNVNSYNPKDYALIVNGEYWNMSSCTIKKKSEISKFELQNKKGGDL